MENIILTAIHHVWPFLATVLGIAMAILGFGNAADLINQKDK